MKIHELAEQTGLSVHTIRFYEKEGLLDSRHVQREKTTIAAMPTKRSSV